LVRELLRLHRKHHVERKQHEQHVETNHVEVLSAASRAIGALVRGNARAQVAACCAFVPDALADLLCECSAERTSKAGPLWDDCGHYANQALESLRLGASDKVTKAGAEFSQAACA
jgi:hypothetical protein